MKLKNKFEWISLFEEWRSSGLSKTEFCNQRELNYRTFLYALKGPVENGRNLTP